MKKLTIEEFKQKLFKIRGDEITVDTSTYKNTRIKCRFIDKDFPNDEWWPTPNNVITAKQSHPKRKQKKIKQTNLKNFGVEYPMQSEEIRKKYEQTCLERYGVKSPQQNAEISLKTAKSSNNSGVIKHWKTDEDCIWKGTWERDTILKMNEIKKEYLWQPEVFKMPDGHTYRPDMYLVKEKIWIEIKRTQVGKRYEKMGMVPQRTPK